jgi:uncharacterized protein (TIGR00369 family)
MPSVASHREKMARRSVAQGSIPSGRGPTAGGRLRQIRAALASGWSAPVARPVGFEIGSIDRGRCRIEFSADERHANPMGTLHGGVLCDIADAAMGMAYASELGSDESFTTIEMKVNFLRPFWTGRLVAEGRVLRKGRAFGLLQCRVVDNEGRLVAFATSTCMTLPAGPDGGLGRPPTSPDAVRPRSSRRRAAKRSRPPKD